MSSNILKLIACLTMLCDHIGYCMQFYRIGDYETQNILRIIGRISFPIFAFLLAEGFKHTKNVTRYASRLLLAGLISEIPYNLCAHGVLRYNGLNVIFTFLTALLALTFTEMCIKNSKKEIRWLFPVPILAACFIAQNTEQDYGYWGIILVFMFYLVDADVIKRKLLLIPAMLIFAARGYIEGYIFNRDVNSWEKIQLFSALAVIPLLMYNGKIGNGTKPKVVKKIIQYLFYLFYPVHLLLLYYIFRYLIR
ncbi:MAG: TraX family protein [Clostridia bacterium]|nr:TraX family protein [Clostridia bacterium]